MYILVYCRWFYIVVVSETLVSLERWENPEDIDIYEVSEYVLMFF